MGVESCHDSHEAVSIEPLASRTPAQEPGVSGQRQEVSIVREGKRLVIAPSNAVWDDFFDSPGIDLPARSELMGLLYPKEYTGGA
jgi:hypothetical protein